MQLPPLHISNFVPSVCVERCQPAHPAALLPSAPADSASRTCPTSTRREFLDRLAGAPRLDLTQSRLHGAPDHMVNAEKDARSYSDQFDDLKGHKDLAIFDKPYPRPNQAANAEHPGAYKLPFSGVFAVHKERPLLAAAPAAIPEQEVAGLLRIMYAQRYFGLIGMHVMALFVAPFYFSWTNVVTAAGVLFFVNCFGITLGYHRLLTHRSFKTFWWLEYIVAWLGSQAGQGGPIEWVSNHRIHHLHTDTPLDPHTPYEGFWFAHMGWFSSRKAAVERPLLDHSNAAELKAQSFYRLLEQTWFPQLILRHALTHWIGGTNAVCWTLAVPIVWGWHCTFLVNSAAHIWGDRPYNTGDLSTNNWWVALLAFGEGWHCNHHAFAYSARHGLEWWQLDVTWMLIRTLQALGLVWAVRLPSEKDKAARRKKTVPGKQQMESVVAAKAGVHHLQSAQRALVGLP